jgi:diaminopimelate decarboxylase
MRAGYRGSEIIFGGVGKTDDELREALGANVLLINVESEGEVLRLNELAGERGGAARVSIRVNPEITVDAAHEYIRTGERGHKFGVPLDDAVRVARLAARLPHLELVGLDMHLGSQLSRVDPYRAGTERLTSIADELRHAGVNTLRYLDIGGGLGVRYDTEEPPDLARFARSVLPLVEASGLQLIMEPGRFIVGNAGVLLTRVLYRKHSGGKEYVITDAGMTELLRPSHYGAFHRIEAVGAKTGRTRADVVGPVCESGDFLALDREVQDVAPGDLLAVFDVGAYGFVMASNYNSRRRGAEVLVDGDRYAIVTARESYETLVQQESDEPEWRS